MFIIFQHWLQMIRAAEKLILVCNLWLGSSFAAFTWAHSCRCTQLEFGWRLASSKTSKIAWCLSICGLSCSRKLNWASSHGGSHISRAQDPIANAYQASACIAFADVPLGKADPMSEGISQEYHYRKVWFIGFHFGNKLPHSNLWPQWFISFP